jgi:hypothetical protein
MRVNLIVTLGFPAFLWERVSGPMTKWALFRGRPMLWDGLAAGLGDGTEKAMGGREASDWLPAPGVETLKERR